MTVVVVTTLQLQGLEYTREVQDELRAFGHEVDLMPASRYPALVAVHKRLLALPQIQAFLASPHRHVIGDDPYVGSKPRVGVAETGPRTHARSCCTSVAASQLRRGCPVGARPRSPDAGCRPCCACCLLDPSVRRRGRLRGWVEVAALVSACIAKPSLAHERGRARCPTCTLVWQPQLWCSCMRMQHARSRPYAYKVCVCS